MSIPEDPQTNKPFENRHPAKSVVISDVEGEARDAVDPEPST
jgi:hypothetical protein